MISLRGQIGCKDYICDSLDELSDIDVRTTSMGSTCFIIEENKTFMLNGEKSWIPVSSGPNLTPLTNEEIAELCAKADSAIADTSPVVG